MEMKLKDFIFTKKLLNPYQVSAIIKTYKDSPMWRHAKIIKDSDSKEEQVDLNERNVSVHPIRIDSKSLTEIHWFNYISRAIHNACIEYADLHGFQHPVSHEGIDLLRYKKGGFYKPHVDSSADGFRKYSIVTFLNNDYEGGHLRFFCKGKNGDEYFDIQPEPGKCVVWPSTYLFMHAALPVIEGTRYAMVSWCK